MIEMDEEEHAQSNFTDITIQFILEIYGPDIRDMLLIKKVTNVD